MASFILLHPKSKQNTNLTRLQGALSQLSEVHASDAISPRSSKIELPSRRSWCEINTPPQIPPLLSHTEDVGRRQQYMAPRCCLVSAVKALHSDGHATSRRIVSKSCRSFFVWVWGLPG